MVWGGGGRGASESWEAADNKLVGVGVEGERRAPTEVKLVSTVAARSAPIRQGQ